MSVLDDDEQIEFANNFLHALEVEITRALIVSKTKEERDNYRSLTDFLGKDRLNLTCLVINSIPTRTTGVGREEAAS